MKFTPKSEQECNAFPVLDPGWYEAVVESAEAKVSKNKNDMIEIRLRVYDPDDTKPGVYDYLMANVAYKLRHFCEAAGLMSEYNAGSLTATDCLNSRVSVHLVIEKSPEHGDKNKVKDYRALDGKAAASKPASDRGDYPQEDDIPF